MINFPRLPVKVARDILFNKVHPVTAWRYYYGISKEQLALTLAISEFKIDQIENSNLHLDPYWSSQLCKVFNLNESALSIRYISMCH